MIAERLIAQHALGWWGRGGTRGGTSACVTLWGSYTMLGYMEVIALKWQQHGSFCPLLFHQIASHCLPQIVSTSAVTMIVAFFPISILICHIKHMWATSPNECSKQEGINLDQWTSTILLFDYKCNTKHIWFQYHAQGHLTTRVHDWTEDLELSGDSFSTALCVTEISQTRDHSNVFMHFYSLIPFSLLARTYCRKRWTYYILAGYFLPLHPPQLLWCRHPQQMIAPGWKQPRPFVSLSLQMLVALLFSNEPLKDLCLCLGWHTLASWPVMWPDNVKNNVSQQLCGTIFN